MQFVWLFDVLLIKDTSTLPSIRSWEKMHCKTEPTFLVNRASRIANEYLWKIKKKSKWVILPKFSTIKPRECTPAVKVFHKLILINLLFLNEFWYISFMLAAWLGQPFCADKPEIYHQSFILTVTSRVKFSSHQFKKCKDQLITSVTLNY